MVLTVASDQSRSGSIRSAISVAESGSLAAHSTSITSSSASLIRGSIDSPFDYSCKQYDYSCKQGIFRPAIPATRLSEFLTLWKSSGMDLSLFLADLSHFRKLARRL